MHQPSPLTSDGCGQDPERTDSITSLVAAEAPSLISGVRVQTIDEFVTQAFFCGQSLAFHLFVPLGLEATRVPVVSGCVVGACVWRAAHFLHFLLFSALSHLPPPFSRPWVRVCPVTTAVLLLFNLTPHFIHHPHRRRALHPSPHRFTSVAGNVPRRSWLTWYRRCSCVGIPVVVRCWLLLLLLLCLRREPWRLSPEQRRFTSSSNSSASAPSEHLRPSRTTSSYQLGHHPHRLHFPLHRYRRCLPLPSSS